MAFPIVKLTNLWSKHVAIPVGSYCTSVYFDGHHSQSLIRMSPLAVAPEYLSVVCGIWYLVSGIRFEASVASLKSKSCKRLTAPQKLSQQTHDEIFWAGSLKRGSYKAVGHFELPKSRHKLGKLMRLESESCLWWFTICNWMHVNWFHLPAVIISPALCPLSRFGERLSLVWRTADSGQMAIGTL